MMHQLCDEDHGISYDYDWLSIVMEQSAAVSAFAHSAAFTSLR
jgi:hypothetical protein